MRHVGDVVSAGWHFFGDGSADFLCLKYCSGLEIVEGKFRFGTTGARHAGAGFGGLPIPKNTVARRVSHRSATAEFIEETPSASALAELRGRLFVFEELNAGATRLSEGFEEGLGTLEIVEGDIFGAAGGDGYEDLCDPIRVSRATWNIDNRQAPLRAEVGTQEAALRTFQILETDVIDGVRLSGGDAAPAGAVT